MQPRTGKIIWKYRFSRKGLNVTPLVVDGKVYTGQSEENRDDSSMGAFAAIDGSVHGNATDNGELWRIKEVMVGKPSPTYAAGHIIAPDESGSVYVLDPKTGESVSKRRTKMLGTIVRASPLFADGKIYACSTSAWHVYEPTEDGVKLLQRLRLPIGEECYGSPIASHGRIYVTTTSAIYCLGKKDHKPTATERPKAPQETPVDSDQKIAVVQVVPAELLLAPGEKQNYTVRLYNERGQLLNKQAKAKFAVDGPAEISADGTIAAASSAQHVAATVSATVDGVSGFARVRIVPPLPWKFDFSNGEVPITWIGARYRHQPREIDGEKLIVKIDTIPLGTRSKAWMGPTDLHDYTVQADVRGAIKENLMPDMGVIAQRYTLDLMGVSQQLQIRSWAAQLENRFAVTVPFKWEPNKWYTMKFSASTDGGKAVLRGKVWPRGQQEPQAWSIEGTDEVPNLTGSPGLFGNAHNAEIWIDNVSVTPNGGGSLSKR
jgi:hypothetical protein